MYSTVSKALGGSVCFQACVVSIKQLCLHTYIQTHWLNGYLPREPGLARCPLNFPSQTVHKSALGGVHESAPTRAVLN